ncbi:MAG: hypothetical protein ABIW76_13155 [Fibrobacteria bacterium]
MKNADVVQGGQPEVEHRFAISTGMRKIEHELDQIHAMLIEERTKNRSLTAELEAARGETAALQASVDALRARVVQLTGEQPTQAQAK